MITHRAAPFYFGLAKLRQVKCFRVHYHETKFIVAPSISDYFHLFEKRKIFTCYNFCILSSASRYFFFFLIEVNTLRPIFEEIENSKLRWYFFSLSFFRAISRQRFFAAFASRSNQTQSNVWKKKNWRTQTSNIDIFGEFRANHELM